MTAFAGTGIWQQVDRPRRAGFYAFRGTCRMNGHHVRRYATIFPVEREPVGRGLAVRTSSSNWRRIDMFDGEWWAISLPWEQPKD